MTAAGWLTAGLGLAGWAGAGLLGATLLVGRSGPLPSARWLGMALLTWLALAILAWLAGPTAQPLPAVDPAAVVAGGPPPEATAAPGRRDSGALWTPAVALLPSFALLALVLPLLPLLYADDRTYHDVAGGATAGRALLLYLLGLALGGAAWRRAAQTMPVPVLAPVPPAPWTSPAARGAAGRRAALTFTAPVVPVVAVTAMVMANYGLFGALQAHVPVASTALYTLGINLALAAGGAMLGVVAFGGPALAAVALWTAWLAFAPWRETLVTDPRAGASLALGAAGIFLLSRRREAEAGATLALFGILVPPALVALPALAILGRWRGASAGLAAAVAVAILATLAGNGPLSAWPADAGPADLRSALWGTPHLQNAALGAFHARLFLGPESLAATTPPPLSPPAFALTLGALLTGAWLTGQAIARARRAGPAGAAVAVCLAMVAGLLLAGTAPRPHLTPAMLAVLPLAGAARWGEDRGRGWLLGLGVAGFVCAATSVPALATAAAPILSRWPPLASPPVLGLALLTVLLSLLCLRAGATVEAGAGGQQRRPVGPTSP